MGTVFCGAKSNAIVGIQYTILEFRKRNKIIYRVVVKGATWKGW